MSLGIRGCIWLLMHKKEIHVERQMTAMQQLADGMH